MFLLDSDHLSLIQRHRGDAYDRLAARLQKVPESELFIPIIAFHERINGWNAFIAKATTENEVIFAYSKFQETLADFADVQLVEYSEAASIVFQNFRKQRLRIGTMDLRIASIAIACRLTLLTGNTIDFERVPGLLYEDWTTVSRNQ